jgi:hypothetical protein
MTSVIDKTSLSTTFYDPEAEPVPEPEPVPAPKPDPSLRTGPKTGARTKKKAKRKIKWFNVWRTFFWAAISLISVVSLYRGVQGWLGQDIAYLALAVSVLVAALLLDRDWKKMRKK